MENILNKNINKNFHNPTWCPGCGNFGIWQALKEAVNKLSLKPTQVVAVFGIGCHGNMVNWSPVTPFAGLHGRTLPIASGIKLVRPDLTVLAIAGDGDCYGEGGNHLIHAARRNLDLTLLVHNNQVYALTTGQTSPSSNMGFKSKSTPNGVLDIALNPLAFSIVSGATFVARGFAGDISHLTDLIIQAINHHGFAIVDILQPCVTFNQINTFEWFKERVYDLNKENHNIKDKLEALKRSLEWPKNGNDSKIPIGLFYQEEREIIEKAKIKKEYHDNLLNNLIKEFL